MVIVHRRYLAPTVETVKVGKYLTLVALLQQVFEVSYSQLVPRSLVAGR